MKNYISILLLFPIGQIKNEQNFQKHTKIIQH
jgi:hypothetical protein